MHVQGGIVRLRCDFHSLPTKLLSMMKVRQWRVLCSSDRSCYGHIYQLQLKSGLKNMTEIQWPSTSLYNQKSGLLACSSCIEQISITQHESRCVCQCNTVPSHQAHNRITEYSALLCFLSGIVPCDRMRPCS
ncbi:hypothetical protein BDR06DRAFT_127720 [Suillus hirtellus]|nr:hypothetical protein BDR06DRAFT_127720 [Suillus hirtellus]